jgi:hypothetical protein
MLLYESQVAYISGESEFSTIVLGLLDLKRLVNRREVSMSCILRKCDAKYNR